MDNCLELYGWEQCHLYPQLMHIRGYLAVYLMPSVHMAWCWLTNWFRPVPTVIDVVINTKDCMCHLLDEDSLVAPVIMWI